ncbi:MAG: YaiO family outer membrane beta-barrel protein [Gemmatimonadota bacterium]|nr:MAG: YaiO family outer membrane beta-barrel protein [Gemmatimonadota bacterium]
MSAQSAPAARPGAVDGWTLSAPQEDETGGVRSARYRFGAGYGFFYFDQDFDPWHLGEVSVERKDNTAALIARLNYAYRFDESAVQVEGDAYPFLTRNVYGYLNVGYSPSSSFPKLRLGADLWANLPGAWEISGGVRYLRFPDEQFPMLTGSLGRYYGDYWTSLRPFLVFDDSEVSWSLGVVTRRYYVDADNYFGLLASYGDAPDPNISDEELDRVGNFLLEFAGKHPLSPMVSWAWVLSYQWEELSGRGNRNRVGFRVAFERRF